MKPSPHIASPRPNTTHWVSALSAVCLLSACTSIQQAKELSASTNEAIRQAQARAAEPTPVVTSRPGAWLAGTRVGVSKPPLPILDKEFAYHPTGPVGLSDIASWITQTTGLSVDTSEIQGTGSMGGIDPMQAGQAGAQATAPDAAMGAMAMQSRLAGGIGLANQPARENLWRMNINYDGKLSGLLDVAANKSGAWWRVDDGRIVFYRTLTRTFFFVAPSQRFSGSETIATSAGGSATSGGGSGTGTTPSGTLASSSATNNTSTYSFDLWADLERTAKTVAGGAQVAVNPSAGSITVTGTPAQVRQVEQWAKQQNEKLSQQVAITVRMFTVKLTHEDHYSWDPSIVFKSVNGVLSGTMTGVQVPAIASGTAAAALGLSIGGNNAFTGTKLAYNALSTLGDVSETMNQTVVALNGHPVPMQLVNSQGYICNVSTAQTANVGTSTSITQCNLTTGFTALFVPSVVNGKVILEMKMTRSTNNGFTSTPPMNGSYVQTANVDNFKFEQPVSLTPGDALLLTGLQHDTGSTQRSGIGSAFNALLGGGVSGTSGKTVIAIMVSAKIL